MSAQPASRPWPTDLEFDRKVQLLRIAFDDGAHFEIPFELLRIESPSAENKGHGANPLPRPPAKPM
ncbi:MAG: gamma-butyrobetaine hydroxylase-like domain-containing protein [Terricaulis sp.]|nr:gamma-butyrobetaine hydroxylase-like domain-containing protein [Terricaulis sp.]